MFGFQQGLETFLSFFEFSWIYSLCNYLTWLSPLFTSVLVLNPICLPCHLLENCNFLLAKTITDIIYHGHHFIHFGIVQRLRTTWKKCFHPQHLCAMTVSPSISLERNGPFHALLIEWYTSTDEPAKSWCIDSDDVLLSEDFSALNGKKFCFLIIPSVPPSSHIHSDELFLIGLVQELFWPVLVSHKIPATLIRASQDGRRGL